MKNNRILFTVLSLLSPMLVFAAGNVNGEAFLYSIWGMAAVVGLFALYALMRSSGAGNQVQTAGASDSYQSNQSYASTGNDAIVQSNSSTEGFSGSSVSGGNDIFDDERDILLDHEYDGIQELNNKLPPWWVGLFWVTIIMAAIYFPYYHMFSGWTSAKEYETDMAIAQQEVDAYLKASGGAVTENNVVLMKGDSDVAAGAEIFKTNCTACHLADGGGQIGPNLTDKFWLHGGSIKDVFSTVKNGVPGTAMNPWKSSLTPTQLQQVASFILVKLQGTTPATPKAPEGDEYVPE